MLSNEASLIDYVAYKHKSGNSYNDAVVEMQEVLKNLPECEDKDVITPFKFPQQYYEAGKKKRIAMLCPNWLLGGCATSAANWTRTINNHCKDWYAELVVINKSGKPGKHYRRDHHTTLLPCGKKVGPEFATEYLNSFDLVMIWGVDDQLPSVRFQKVMPYYTDVVLGIKVPVIVYFQCLFDLEETSVLIRETMKLPNVVALGSMRSRLLDIVKKAPFVNEELPSFLFLHHPEKLPEFSPNANFAYTGHRPRLVLSMTRIAYSKRPRIIVRAFRDLLRDHPNLVLDYELWGSVMGREIWKIEKDLPDSEELAPIMKRRYFGAYDTNNVKYIYERGCFSIDLTRMIGDGGMQNASMESMTHGVIPIVPTGWDPAEGMVALPIPDDDKKMDHDNARDLLVDALVRLAETSSGKLVEMQKANWDWIAENRDPAHLAAEFEVFMNKVTQ